MAPPAPCGLEIFLTLKNSAHGRTPACFPLIHSLLALRCPRIPRLSSPSCVISVKGSKSSELSAAINNERRESNHNRLLWCAICTRDRTVSTVLYTYFIDNQYNIVGQILFLAFTIPWSTWLTLTPPPNR